MSHLTKTDFREGERVIIDAPQDVNHGVYGRVAEDVPAAYGNVVVYVKHKRCLFQPNQLKRAPRQPAIRKDRYQVGDVVRLIPDPYSAESGPDPRDFDMPAPVVMITAVETHTYNPEWVLGYTVRPLCEDAVAYYDGGIEKIKPGKIDRLVLDAALIRRVKRTAAFDHAIQDPYATADPRFPSILFEVRDRLYFARRAREEGRSKTGFSIPAARPWTQVHVEIVREDPTDPEHLASVEVTYGLGNPARAVYGVGRDGIVYCWAD